MFALDNDTPGGSWEGLVPGTYFGLSGLADPRELTALYSYGIRPDANAGQVATGMPPLIDGDPEDSLSARYGHLYRSNVAQRLAASPSADPSASMEERMERVRNSAAREIYYIDRRTYPRTEHELSRFRAALEDNAPASAGGVDLTFIAPRSASILWALGDAAVQDAIEESQTIAVRTIVQHMETGFLTGIHWSSRLRRVPVLGLAATRFRHYTTIDGQPNLHDHLVVSRSLLCQDDEGQPRWALLDRSAIPDILSAMNGYYEAALWYCLYQRLGLSTERRSDDHEEERNELSCVDEALIHQFRSPHVRSNDVLDARLDLDHLNDLSGGSW